MNNINLTFYIIIIFMIIKYLKNVCFINSNENFLNTQTSNMFINKFIDNLASWFPELATVNNDFRFNNKLDNVSFEYFLSHKKDIENLKKEFLSTQFDDIRFENKILDPFESSIIKTTISNMISQLESSYLENNYKYYTLYLEVQGGPHFDLYYLLLYSPKESIKDIQDILERLKQFPKKVDQEISILKQGIKFNIISSTDVIKSIIKSLSIVIENCSNTDSITSDLCIYYNAFKITEQNSIFKELIKKYIIPSLIKYNNFIKNDYLPLSQENSCLSLTSEGKFFYKTLVKNYTTLDLTPEEVHSIGLEYVEKLNNQMITLREGMKDKDLFSEDKYCKSREEYLEYNKDCAKRLLKLMPKYFNDLPDLTYYIEDIQDGQEDASDHYVHETKTFYCNTTNYISQPRWTILSTVAHELLPGHHLQACYEEKFNSLKILKNWNDFTVYSEGWALYAETLIYTFEDITDEERYGFLTNKIYRACRLVVDTGLHYYGWSKKQAFDFLQKYTKFGDDIVENQIVRYLGNPGQALSYLIGEIQFWKYLNIQLSNKDNLMDIIKKYNTSIVKLGNVPMEVISTIKV